MKFASLVLFSFAIESMASLAIPDWIYYGRGLNRLQINKLRQRCDLCESSSSEENDKVETNDLNKPENISASITNRVTTDGTTQESLSISSSSSFPDSTSNAATTNQVSQPKTTKKTFRKFPEKALTTDESSTKIPSTSATENVEVTETTEEQRTDSSFGTSTSEPKTSRAIIRSKPDTIAPVSEPETLPTSSNTPTSNAIEASSSIPTNIEDAKSSLNTYFATEHNSPTYLKPDLSVILKKLFKGTN